MLTYSAVGVEKTKTHLPFAACGPLIHVLVPLDSSSYKSDHVTWAWVLTLPYHEGQDCQYMLMEAWR